MPGTQELREALEAATKLRVPHEYRARLHELKNQFNHSIEILPGVYTELQWFNCFAHALGVSGAPRYLELAKERQSSVLVNSDLVSDRLAGGELIEVAADHAQTGDIVLYFAGDELSHAGVVITAGPVPRRESKWGGAELHIHPLWEVPVGYGDHVRFFKRPDAAVTLAHLDAACRDDGNISITDWVNPATYDLVPGIIGPRNGL